AAQAEVRRVIGAPRTLSASLAPKEGIAGSARVLVDAASGESVIVVSGLAPAPEGKTYELWALRGDRPPEPAGLFAVGTEGSIARRSARVERPGEVTAFAVSIEPADRTQRLDRLWQRELLADEAGDEAAAPHLPARLERAERAEQCAPRRDPRLARRELARHHAVATEELAREAHRPGVVRRLLRRAPEQRPPARGHEP